MLEIQSTKKRSNQCVRTLVLQIKSCPKPPPLAYTYLQLVFNGCRSQENEIFLDFFVDSVQLVLPVLKGDGGLVVRLLPLLKLTLGQVLDAQAQGPEAVGGKFLQKRKKKYS